ncbi:MAG: hypothetical protein GY795_27920 [Desulfobacterales bacterium]|nr:hypothetical protein [Desulfobacterales bacterium]
MIEKNLPGCIIIIVIMLITGTVNAEELSLSEEEVLKWLKKHVPNQHSELLHLKKEEPEEYKENLIEMIEQIEYFESVRKQDSAMYERLVEAENLEFKSWELAKKIALTKNTDKKKIQIAQLETILGKLFDIRQQEKNMEIKALKKEIDEIQDLLNRRKTNKNKIIERRMKEMVSEFNEALEWW